MVNSRECTKCTVTKPLSEFSRAPRGRYGVKATCKACDAARFRAQYVPAVVDEAAKEERYTKHKSDTKTCTQCGVEKSTDLFSKTRDGKYGPVFRADCKACQASRALEWFRNNRERSIATARRTHLRKAYGITVEEYDGLLEKQDHRCGICGEPESTARAGKTMSLAVDHCHGSGRVRGLLCNNCNRAVGLLKDDAELLRKAIVYLESR
jgi:hypothetical protein